MNLQDNFKKEAGVYIFTNLLNGKQYVGKSININARMCLYRGTASKGYIYSAIRKYGKDNFDIYVEYLPDFNNESLLELETELIKRFNTLSPNGYNLCAKGRDATGIKRRPESIKASADKRTGMKRTPEQKALMSKKSYWTGKVGATKGMVCKESTKQKLRDRVITEEWRENIKKGRKSPASIAADKMKGENRKGKYTGLKSPNAKKVSQFDLEGNLVAIHPTVKDAGLSIGITNVMMCKKCTYNLKHTIPKPYKDFIWKYAEN